METCGEGNGNPLQWSCLENPRDRGAWWAAVDGVAQSRTRLKRLSSSSSSSSDIFMKSDLSRFVFWRPFWNVDWRKMTAIVQARDAKALGLGSDSGDKE